MKAKNITKATQSQIIIGNLSPTRIEMDHRVKSIMDLMQQTLPADELLGVAEAVAAVAPSIWGRYRYEKIVPLMLAGVPMGGLS